LTTETIISCICDLHCCSWCYSYIYVLSAAVDLLHFMSLKQTQEW